MIKPCDRAEFDSFMSRVDAVVDSATGGLGMKHGDFVDANWPQWFYSWAYLNDDGTRQIFCLDEDIIDHLAGLDPAFAMNVEAAKALAAAGDLAVLP